MAGKFIQGAIKRPGALTQKANAAGMSVAAFAQAHQHDKGLTGEQSRFYLRVLRPASKSRSGSRGSSLAKAASNR
jgi:hypothetical protein